MGRVNKELAYFAGFFDGEGCIVIASQGGTYEDKAKADIVAEAGRLVLSKLKRQ